MCYFSSDSGSNCDSDPGNHGRSCSGADDSRWDSDGPGSPAEDHPAAGVDCSHLTADPDASSPQPRPAAHAILCCRVPGAAAHSAAAAHQGSSSTGWHQGQNSCQAQRGGQLSFVQYRCDRTEFFRIPQQLMPETDFPHRT